MYSVRDSPKLLDVTNISSKDNHLVELKDAMRTNGSHFASDEACIVRSVRHDRKMP